MMNLDETSAGDSEPARPDFGGEATPSQTGPDGERIEQPRRDQTDIDEGLDHPHEPVPPGQSDPTLLDGDAAEDDT